MTNKQGVIYVKCNLVVRDEDSTLFDSSRLEIHKFNQEGYTLISGLLRKPMTMNEYLQFARENGVEELDATSFLQKCIDSGLIEFSDHVG
ncbi:MAG: hypothetical protein GVY17_12305 [Cyanobacteria bacterium]|jgi:hypothetical protein|nr:hypothetical protein [Cyanobacteria bacterium GSL.Bin21]